MASTTSRTGWQMASAPGIWRYGISDSRTRPCEPRVDGRDAVSVASLSRSSSILAARISSTSTRICSSRISRNAVQEGFDNIELLKRYTTVGMGPPGQALQHECGAHSRAAAGQADRRSRHDHRAAVFPSGAARRIWPAAAFTRAPHAAAFAPRARQARYSCRRAFGCARSTTRVTGKSKRDCVPRRRSPCARAVGIIDVGTLGKIEICRPGRRRVPGAHLYRPLRESQSRHDALCG